MRVLLWALLFVATTTGAQDVPTPPPATTVATQDSQTAPAQGDDIVDMRPLVVTGVQPGPGLWKVSKGDHVLWLLGTLSPLPRGIEWDTRAIEHAIAQSQEVLASPSVNVRTDRGFFGNLVLIPSALKARRNPDGKRLQDVVPPAQYARWQVLKARYIGGRRGIESWRPVFAALELYDEAIRKSGMSAHGIVGPAVAKIAKRHGVKIVNPELTITIRKPRQALKEFARTSLDDQDCFAKTLDRIESDLGTMAARANAWAIGDIETLRRLPYGNQFSACSAAFGSAALARKHGVADMAGQIERKWMGAAESALARNRSTFATLPIAELLKADGSLARLRARGYDVQAP